MANMSLNNDLFRSSETQLWRDFRSHRRIMDSRVSAEGFSPRALQFALPLASLLWIAAALAAYPYV